MKTDKKSEHWLSRDDRRQQADGIKRPSHREWQRESVLASWLGEERRAAVFADLRPEPQSMEDLIGQALASVGQQNMLLLAKLREHWSEIVGADNARQSSPLAVERALLRIEIASPTWFYVFEHQHKKRFAGLVEDYTHGAIKQIQFVPRGYRPPPR